MFKLLIVDDEVLEREALKVIVKKSGLPLEMVGEANNGQAAVALVKEVHPDIIFMDIKMPGKTGIEAIREIMEFDKKVKIVIISAYDDFDYAKDALKMGVFDYLVKPSRVGDTVGMLARLVQVLEQEKQNLEEEKKLRTQLESMVPFIKAGFMMDLINSHSDEKCLMERAAFLGFSPVPAIGMVVDVDDFSMLTRESSEVSRQLAKKNVFDAVENCLKKDESWISVPLFEDKIMVLYGIGNSRSPKHVKEEAKEKALALGEKIRRNVERKTSFTCSVGVGSLSEDFSQVSRSFREARKAHQLGKIFLGGNHVVHIDSIKDMQPMFYWYPYKMEKNLEEKLKYGDQEEINQALDVLIAELSSKAEVDFHHFRIRVFELVVVLSRAAVEGGADLEKVADLQMLISEELFGTLNNWELIETVRGACNRFRELIAEGCQSNTLGIIKTALSFLHRNYTKEICLEDVSHVICLNPSYFSRIFKKEVGMTFIDYLTKLRIDRAKKLLVQSSQSISEIAGSVGYRDANYFSRVFCKVEGVPPSEFRQKLIME